MLLSFDSLPYLEIPYLGRGSYAASHAYLPKELSFMLEN